MKKTLLFILALSFITNLTAQTFVGGSIGFDNTSGKQTTKYGSNTNIIDSKTTNNFTLAPMIGYMINDAFAAGVEFSIISTNVNDNKETPTINTSSSWSVSPFVRYYFYKINKFTVYGQLNFNVGGSQDKQKVGDITIESPLHSFVGVNFFPALEYNLSDRVGLFANLNFLSFGYNSLISKSTSVSFGDNIEDKYTTNFFYFGADTSNLLKTNNFQIGFFLKF